MWQRHRLKEYILIIVVLLISSIDLTEVRLRGRIHVPVRGRPFRQDRRTNVTTSASVDQQKSVNSTNDSTNNSTNNSTISSNLTTVTPMTSTTPFLYDTGMPVNKMEGTLYDEYYEAARYYRDWKTMKDYPDATEESKLRVCYIIATTYISALSDLRRFFEMRYFYENNLEFEVGYMTSEIISKYQRMLEIYFMAQKRFLNYEDREYIPASHMVYLYTNLLEMGTVITHLCNMLHEIDQKYNSKKSKKMKTGFDDYHLGKDKLILNGTSEYQNAMKALLAYQKSVERERRKREKLKIKQRQKNLHDLNFRPTPPSRIPKKGPFELHYGWSIEDW